VADEDDRNPNPWVLLVIFLVVMGAAVVVGLGWF
jgi:hypothetical protein